MKAKDYIKTINKIIDVCRADNTDNNVRIFIAKKLSGIYTDGYVDGQLEIFEDKKPSKQ